MRLAIVIPTLDEAAGIESLLDHVTTLAGVDEIVVSDGGSTDETAALAERHRSQPLVVRHREASRALQLNAGTAATDSDAVVFLHADSRLPANGLLAIRWALSEPGVVGGNFALRFDGDDHFGRLLGAVYAAQRRGGFYYGDSSVWCARSTFDALGGFRELPIMDDYDFVRRMETLGPTRCLPGPATTSARRWRATGIRRTVFSWVVIRWLYLAGVEPARLARLYRRVR